MAVVEVLYSLYYYDPIEKRDCISENSDFIEIITHYRILKDNGYCKFHLEREKKEVDNLDILLEKIGEIEKKDEKS